MKCVHCCFELCATTLSIWQVGDFGLQGYQTEIKLERATAVEFTTFSPICYIHCCVVVLLLICQTIQFLL